MLAFLFVYFLFLLLIWKVGHLFVSDLPLKGRLSTWPDDTDEEYLSQMPEGISADVALQVRSILIGVSGCDPDEVWPETALVDLFG